MDATYAIALGSPRDQHHARAASLAAWIRDEPLRLVTTRAVLLEIGNALAKQRHRSAAVALLGGMQRDPRIEILPVSEDLYAAGWDLFRRHQDKEWGLTDCLSFVVMRQRGITDALSADEHFRQAGFRTLLTDD